MLKQLKGKDLKPLKEKWWLINNKRCPIIDQEFELDDMVVDHQHKLKAQRSDETGLGICRGALHRSANAWEGKLTNSFKRLGLHQYTDIVSALRNLADYLEHNHIYDDIQYIHPNEAPQRLKVTKRSYNKLKSVMKKANAKKKIPKYTGNPTKPLVELFKKFDVEIEYYERSDEIIND